MRHSIYTILIFSGVAIMFWVIPMTGLTQSIGNNFPSIPNQVSGTETLFEITDSDYLNVILESTLSIEATVNSAPKVVSIIIQPSPAFSTQLTLSGFIPNKTYYRYDNSFRNETVFTTDNVGSFTFAQNISQGHHIWIQENSGTIFIPADCDTVGTFDIPTSTCTLNQDLSDNIEITNDGITLNCDGHILSDGWRWTSFAILLNNRQNVTVKNCTIKNASNAINISFSNNNTFINNNTSGNGTGIIILSSNNNTVSGNNSSANGQGIALASFSKGNMIRNNDISDIRFGIIINQSQSNTIEENIIDGHSSSGINITALSTKNNIINNVISNNGFGITLFNTLSNYGNTIIDNTIRDNTISGITIGMNSRNTKVFNNNFINNAIQAQAFSVNFFDNGLPDGGNYWNNYDTPIEGCDDIDTDGFCDAPFAFTGGLDNFPWTTQNGWKSKNMIRPTIDGKLIQPFRPLDNPDHFGIDVDSTVNGESVFAAADGVIVKIATQPEPGCGKWVWIFHGDVIKRDNTVASKISTRYFHMDNLNEALRLGPIAQGVELGRADSTGNITGPHLHFNVRQGDLPIDKACFKSDRPDDTSVAIDPLNFVDYDRGSGHLDVTLRSNADIVLIDPDGFEVSKEVNQLPDAEYIEVIHHTLNEDEGLPEYDTIQIENRKIGDYLVTVIPEPQAIPSDTYSLSATRVLTTTILAQDITIGDIPDQPYIIRSTETEIEKIIPATIRVEPETLNLSRHGAFFVFLQLPRGFGAIIEDIDTNTIILSGASPRKTTFNKGTNTLNIKFNTRDLVDVSSDNEVTLTLTGQLFDGTSFEGNDTIRVIKKGGRLSTIVNIFYGVTDFIMNFFATIDFN